MKRDAFDVFKVIVLLIVTSLLVMAYTTIEKSVSVPSAKTNLAIPGADPVAPKLAGKSKNTEPVQKAIKNEYVIIKYYWQAMNPNVKKSYKTRYTLLLL